ncbi:hypothetical protein ACA910_020908 [Epithemia clementina (nom. ined.)]
MTADVREQPTKENDRQPQQQRRSIGRRRWPKVVDVFALFAGVFVAFMYYQSIISVHYASLHIQRLGSLKEGWSLLSIGTDHNPNATTRLPVEDEERNMFPNAGQKELVANQTESVTVVTSSTATAAPWRTSKVLPQWMKDYFQWHQDSLRSIRESEHNWKNYSYLIGRCLASDRCGGGADRLQKLPFLLLLAHRSRRLLFFHWERPASLEEFLVPPPDGLNWTWPPHPAIVTATKFQFSKFPEIRSGGLALKYMSPVADLPTLLQSQRRVSPAHALDRKQIISVAFQTHNHGRVEYDLERTNNETEAPFLQVFRDCWHSVYVPSKPVQERIDWRMQQLHLRPNQYHAIHIRSRHSKELSADVLQKMTSNSVNCLRQITATTDLPLVTTTTNNTSSTPIFVASDGRPATRATAKYALERGLNNIITTRGFVNQTWINNPDSKMDEKEDEEDAVLHLDRGTEFLSRRLGRDLLHGPHRYYDTFVDLYLLSKSRCLVFGVGNYGRWANLISDDVWCHRDTAWGPKSLTQCSWSPDDSSASRRR